MTLTVLPACVHAPVAWEVGASAGTFLRDESHRLLGIGTCGIRSVGGVHWTGTRMLWRGTCVHGQRVYGEAVLDHSPAANTGIIFVSVKLS